MQWAGITKGKKDKPEAVYQTRVDSWRNKKQHLYPAYFTLKDRRHFFFSSFPTQMLTLQGQGNDRAISFSNHYPNMSGVQHPVQQSYCEKTIIPETITLYDFLFFLCFLFFFFSPKIAYFQPACLSASKEQSHRALLTFPRNKMTIFWWRHLWFFDFKIPYHCVSFGR